MLNTHTATTLFFLQAPAEQGNTHEKHSQAFWGTAKLTEPVHISAATDTPAELASSARDTATE